MTSVKKSMQSDLPMREPRITKRLTHSYIPKVRALFEVTLMFVILSNYKSVT